MAEYELCEPFDIDHGELDGLRPQECFVLGVEWQMLMTELNTGRTVERTIHTRNVERFRKILRQRGREFNMTTSGDPCWTFLVVEAM